MIQDVESIRESLVNLVRDNLEDKINEVLADRGDIDLPIPSLTNMVASMGDKVLNSQVFMHYGIVDIETLNKGVTGFVSYNIKMFFMIASIRSQNESEDPEVRALRYSRALQSVFLDNAHKIKGGKIEVTPYAPIDWASDADSPYWKVGGVEVDFVAAS